MAHSTGTGQHEAMAYWLHLGSFIIYNALITYTMALRLRTGFTFALLFTIAMGLHFVLTDRSLEEHYPRRFRKTGRLLLAAPLIVCWALSTIFAPTSTVLVAVLTALLGGSILSTFSRRKYRMTGAPVSAASLRAWSCIRRCWR